MLDLHWRGNVVVVRFRAAGVLDLEVLDGLSAALAYIGPGRPIVLTGTGTVFAPGADPAPGPARAAVLARLPEVLGALRAHPMPVVAAINGDATGAGFSLAEAAGFRIMSGGVVHRGATRYTAREAVAAGLVELHCSPARLLDLALRQAARPQAPALAG
jgi:enoyl-CoA hydratase